MRRHFPVQARDQEASNGIHRPSAAGEDEEDLLNFASGAPRVQLPLPGALPVYKLLSYHSLSEADNQAIAQTCRDPRARGFPVREAGSANHRAAV